MFQINSKIFRRSLLDSLCFSFMAFVVGFVIFRPTEEQQLNLQVNVLILLTTLIGGAFLSHIINQKGVETWGEHLFKSNFKSDYQLKPWFKTFWGWQLFVLVITLFVVGFFKTDFSFLALLNKDGFQGAKNLFMGLSSPNWAILPKAVYNILESIFMAFMATALAIPFAFVLSFLSAKNLMNGPITFWVYLFLRIFFNIMRSIEAIIWAIIFSVWVGIGPFAGMLALMIHSIASLAKQYSEMIETVSDGPIEGVLSCGANKMQMIWFSIVPQVFLPFISFTVYRWDINIRMATIVGFVGGGGIGTMLYQYQGQAMWREVGTIVLVIATVVWMMDQASAYIREALK